MKQSFRKPVILFLILAVAIAMPLFLLPLNLFSGEIIWAKGLVETKTEAPLSLSYFIGIGYSEEDMVGIKDFYLLPKGYVLAFLFTLGLPALISYRLTLKKTKKSAVKTKN
jgi:hypothetical protein